MTIANKTVLVTGANRGIGLALVNEALARGAKRVYAATRQSFTHDDVRVIPLAIDVTNEAQIQQAFEQVDSLDVLINNAGISLPDDLSDRASLDRHLEVNVFGTYYMTKTFLPLLERSRGAIVNIVSIGALAAVPILPSYSLSKAAAFSLSQSVRALLAAYGVSVHIVLPGPVDTDMVRALDIPKESPQTVARNIIDGVERGEEEIFPDPFSAMLAESWRGGAVKALERQNAALLVQSEALA
ncbi:MAG TPA: SDR family NAD(P)-dependent oxidoreductase [Candidatus Baltobacteraceae bacterium]|nr:SDR family NAD(P)-dependent oxidoreductase [Candidatus Baltobacteraceae bacterium]